MIDAPTRVILLFVTCVLFTIVWFGQTYDGLDAQTIEGNKVTLITLFFCLIILLIFGNQFVDKPKENNKNKKRKR